MLAVPLARLRERKRRACLCLAARAAQPAMRANSGRASAQAQASATRAWLYQAVQQLMLGAALVRRCGGRGCMSERLRRQAVAACEACLPCESHDSLL
jgi:hypothetical protein